MQRFIAGTATFTLTLTPVGPWMVRGHPEREPFTDNRGQPSEREVLIPLLDQEGVPYIPGSSLKGVLRSTAERILRSVHPDRDPTWVPMADDPFVHEKGPGRLPESRSQIADSELLEWLAERPDEWLEAHQPYKLLRKNPDDLRRLYPLLSPASQLFGCTLHAGLVVVGPARALQVARQRRSHVAVDRFSGGVGAGPFVEELAAAGAPLAAELRVANFALWQIALLALAIQELNRGYQGLGGGTRKGQGKVRLSVERLECSYAGWAYDDGETGVVSAQARRARLGAGGLAEEIPRAVREVEADLRLLPELEPQTADWRAAGTRTLLVQEDAVKRLLHAAVDYAWGPWVHAMRKEDAA